MRRYWFLMLILIFLMTLTACGDDKEDKLAFKSPKDAASLAYGSTYSFKVTSYRGATDYLWGFFQNGEMVWENNRDEGHLSGTEYVIQPGTMAHSRLQPGPVEVWVRALVDGEWSEPTVITINLVQ